MPPHTTSELDEVATAGRKVRVGRGCVLSRQPFSKFSLETTRLPTFPRGSAKLPPIRYIKPEVRIKANYNECDSAMPGVSQAKPTLAISTKMPD